VESQHFTAGRLITAPTLVAAHLTDKLEFFKNKKLASIQPFKDCLLSIFFLDDVFCVQLLVLLL